MAHSLEVRSPFMDYRVAEFACRLPLQYKLRGLTTKHLLRKAFAKDLPPGPLKRQKHGFAVPMGDWFQGPLKAVYEDIVLSSPMKNLVNRDEAGRLLKDHQYGRVRTTGTGSGSCSFCMHGISGGIVESLIR